MKIPFARMLGPVAAAMVLSAPGGRDLAAAPPQPPAGRAAAILSGGVGEDERMWQQAASYNLWLVFAEQGSGNYLAGVRVVVADANDRPVIDAVADGPWLFARVPPGRYRVRTPDGGEQPVTVSGSSRAMAVLRLAPAPGPLP